MSRWPSAVSPRARGATPIVDRALVGAEPSDALFDKAADILLADAKGHGGNDFKIPLARRTLIAVLRRRPRQ